MSDKSWKQLNIEDKMYLEIKELIESDYVKRIYGWGTIPEFIRRAVSDKIKEIKEEIKNDITQKRRLESYKEKGHTILDDQSNE